MLYKTKRNKITKLTNCLGGDAINSRATAAPQRQLKARARESLERPPRNRRETPTGFGIVRQTDN